MMELKQPNQKGKKMKQLKKLLFVSLMILLYQSPLFAKDSNEGVLRANIDKDYRLESVEWWKITTTQMGDYYQLVVRDDDGSILWQGPRKADESNPFIFSSLHIGISLPQIFTDIDQDGFVELLAPYLQSDVSPTTYRRLRWRGGNFEQLASYSLMMLPHSKDRLVWKNTSEYYGIWVSGFEMRNGLIEASITEYREDGTAKTALANISFTRQGATITRWLKPLQSEVVNQQLQKSASSYQARLSYGDHINSYGKSLGTISGILRQDRARFYKGYGDREDQREPYFNTLQSRSMISQYDIVAEGIPYRELENIILYETPLVEVTVQSGRLYIRILTRNMQ